MTSQTRRNKNNAQRAQKMVCKAIHKAFPEISILSPIGDMNDPLYPCMPFVQPRCMGLPGEDIILNKEASVYIPLSIEVKHRKGKKELLDWMKQARSNSNSKFPAVVLHPSGTKELLAIIDFNDLLQILKSWSK